MCHQSRITKINCGCRYKATKEFSKTANLTQKIFPSLGTTRQCCYIHQAKQKHIQSISNIHHKQNNNNKICNNVWYKATKQQQQTNKFCNIDHFVCKSYKITSTHPQKYLSIFIFIMTLTVLNQSQQTLANPLWLKNANKLTEENAMQQKTTEMLLTVDVEEKSQQRLKSDTRINKRYAEDSWHSIYAKEGVSQSIEWSNPCNGVWVETKSPVQPVKTSLRWLQSNVSRELKTLRATTNSAINATNMRSWPKNSHNFLPVIKLNSNVALRRWHRYLQIHVAAFTYLRRAEMHWDQHVLQHASPIYFELDKLKESALSVLCEIETAINNTSVNTHKSRRNIKTIKRAAMEKKLEFQSHLKHVFGHKWDTQQSKELHELISTDLKVAKHRYLSMLRAMLKVLRSHITRPGPVQLDSRSTSSSSSSKGSSKQLNSSQQSYLQSDSKDFSSSINSFETNFSQSSKVRHRKRPTNVSGGHTAKNTNTNLSGNRRHKQHSHNERKQI